MAAVEASEGGARDALGGLQIEIDQQAIKLARKVCFSTPGFWPGERMAFGRHQGLRPSSPREAPTRVPSALPHGLHRAASRVPRMTMDRARVTPTTRTVQRQAPRPRKNDAK